MLKSHKIVLQNLFFKGRESRHDFLKRKSRMPCHLQFIYPCSYCHSFTPFNNPIAINISCKTRILYHNPLTRFKWLTSTTTTLLGQVAAEEGKAGEGEDRDADQVEADEQSHGDSPLQ